MSSLEKIDWSVLEHLRRMYISEAPQLKRDYWNSATTLESYDATFAQRIGWKWDAVLQEFKQLSIPAAHSKILLLDWGCGTGIAARRFVSILGDSYISSVAFFDRSKVAAEFAKQKFGLEFPEIPAFVTHQQPKESFILLVSHVFSELDNSAKESLKEIARSAEAVFFVEPGTPNQSADLITMREDLREHMTVVAPCPHTDQCGLIRNNNQEDWCHNFAKPPSKIFHDPNWSLFAKRMEIDLRSLPVSFLILLKNIDQLTCRNDNMIRVLGRPTVNKTGARFVGCGKNGVFNTTVEKRTRKNTVKQLDKSSFTAFVPLDDTDFPRGDQS